MNMHTKLMTTTAAIAAASPPGNGNSPANHPVITGSWLARAKLSVTESALLADDMVKGRVVFEKPTIKQATQLTGASQGYITTAGRLTSEQRELVKIGKLKLSKVHNHNNRPMSDEAIDRFVLKVGAERVMASLDRFTQPVTHYKHQPSLFAAE